MTKLQKRLAETFPKLKKKINIFGFIVRALFYYKTRLKLHLRSLQNDGLDPLYYSKKTNSVGCLLGVSA